MNSKKLRKRLSVKLKKMPGIKPKKKTDSSKSKNKPRKRPSVKLKKKPGAKPRKRNACAKSRS